jgi:hypothetical protein
MVSPFGESNRSGAAPDYRATLSGREDAHDRRVSEPALMSIPPVPAPWHQWLERRPELSQRTWYVFWPSGRDLSGSLPEPRPGLRVHGVNDGSLFDPGLRGSPFYAVYQRRTGIAFRGRYVAPLPWRIFEAHDPEQPMVCTDDPAEVAENRCLCTGFTLGIEVPAWPILGRAPYGASALHFLEEIYRISPEDAARLADGFRALQPHQPGAFLERFPATLRIDWEESDWHDERAVTRYDAECMIEWRFRDMAPAVARSEQKPYWSDPGWYWLVTGLQLLLRVTLLPDLLPPASCAHLIAVWRSVLADARVTPFALPPVG